MRKRYGIMRCPGVKMVTAEVEWSQDTGWDSWKGRWFGTVVARAWIDRATGRALYWTAPGNRVRRAPDINAAKRYAAVFMLEGGR